MSTLKVALKKDGHAHLDRWLRGTYVFTKEVEGRTTVWMKKRDRRDSFILPFNLEYAYSKDFISGKGTPLCNSCLKAKEVTKAMRRSKSGKEIAKALAEHLKTEHCQCRYL